jgi:soluble lytic murein transglycosylase-like protein
MVYPSGLENVNQRIQEIRHRFESLDKSLRKPEPEASTNTFARIYNEKIQGESRTTPYISSLENLVEQKADAVGLDPELAKAVVKAESGYNPRAVSPAGAKGLMQLMPSTAESLGVQSILNPEDNVRGGTQYLKSLMDKYHSIPKALAAYNAGPGAVDKYGGIPPYQETQNYVKRVMAFQREYESQQQNNVE